MNEKPPGSVSGEPPRESEAPGGAAGQLRPCPICGKPAVLEMRPFCSKRCADVDLHRWLGGTYAIPVVEADGAEAGQDGDEES